MNMENLKSIAAGSALAQQKTDTRGIKPIVAVINWCLLAFVCFVSLHFSSWLFQYNLSTIHHEHRQQARQKPRNDQKTFRPNLRQRKEREHLKTLGKHHFPPEIQCEIVHAQHIFEKQQFSENQRTDLEDFRFQRRYDTAISPQTEPETEGKSQQNPFLDSIFLGRRELRHNQSIQDRYHRFGRACVTLATFGHKFGSGRSSALPLQNCANPYFHSVK